MIDTSWIIENRETRSAVLETFNFETVQLINISKYRVWTAHSWLVEINRRIAYREI